MFFLVDMKDHGLASFIRLEPVCPVLQQTKLHSNVLALDVALFFPVMVNCMVLQKETSDEIDAFNMSSVQCSISYSNMIKIV